VRACASVRMGWRDGCARSCMCACVYMHTSVFCLKTIRHVDISLDFVMITYEHILFPPSRNFVAAFALGSNTRIFAIGFPTKVIAAECWHPWVRQKTKDGTHRNVSLPFFECRTGGPQSVWKGRLRTHSSGRKPRNAPCFSSLHSQE